MYNNNGYNNNGVNNGYSVPNNNGYAMPNNNNVPPDVQRQVIESKQKLIKDKFLEIESMINEQCTDSHAKAHSLQRLTEAAMWASGSIK